MAEDLAYHQGLGVAWRVVPEIVLVEASVGIVPPWLPYHIAGLVAAAAAAAEFGQNLPYHPVVVAAAPEQQEYLVAAEKAAAGLQSCFAAVEVADLVAAG